MIYQCWPLVLEKGEALQCKTCGDPLQLPHPVGEGRAWLLAWRPRFPAVNKSSMYHIHNIKTKGIGHIAHHNQSNRSWIVFYHFLYLLEYMKFRLPFRTHAHLYKLEIVPLFEKFLFFLITVKKVSIMVSTCILQVLALHLFTFKV